MHKFRFCMFAALVACLLCVQAASAQTAANISIVSGSGQVVCVCTLSGQTGFLPMIVKVTDASNKPVANAAVTWTVTLSALVAPGLTNGTLGTNPNTGQQTYVTTTAADGTTSNILVLPGGGFGTATSPPQEIQVTAAAGNGVVTFSETQAFNASGGSGQVAIDPSFLPQAGSGNPITAFSGQQGFTFNGTSSQTIKVGVITNGGVPVPGVSVRIGNFQNSPAASCVTGPGADPGSVLTDSTGYAVCTPVFTGTGSGTFIPVVGGVPLCNCSQDPPSPNLFYSNLVTYYLNVPPPIAIQVTQALPGSITVVSGSGQSAAAGQVVTGTLIAQVNAQGGGTLSGQTVNWSVSPAAAGSLANTSTTSDSNGQVTNTLALSSAASGIVTVTAAIPGTTYQATFSITAIPLITAGNLTIVSGNSQTALVSAQFANPLVVKVTSSTGAAVPNVPVTFSATGGAILSATQMTTDANGQAQVTVTAPATAGNVTVTASAAGFTQTFTLTVSPPGPTLSASSFVNAADFKVGSISPCSLATIIAPGVAPSVQGTVLGNVFGLGALPTTLSGDVVTFSGTQAPILNVATINNSQRLTFQVPCNTLAGSNQVTVAVGSGSATTSVNVQPVSPGVFQTATNLQVSSGATFPMGVFVRPDGSYVSQSNPARKGDTIIAYATGLGSSSPSVGTNALPLPTANSSATSTLVIGVANAGVPLISAQLSPDLVGVYLVSFQVPTSAPSGNQVFSVGVSFGGQTYYSSGAAIPIQ